MQYIDFTDVFGKTFRVSKFIHGAPFAPTGRGIDGAFELMDRYRALGGNTFDVARFYGYPRIGYRESILADYIKDRDCRDDVVIITKGGMPELNDEFARAQGFSDAAALRQAIMSAALQRKEAQARDAYADALVRQVLDGMEVRVPDSMVESQLTGLLQELENRLMSQGASLSDYLQMAGMTEEDLRAHARENALESARYELAMTEIARLEHIRVTDEDVERRYQEMSRQFGVPVEHIRQQLPPMQLSHDLKLAYARAVVVDSGVRL